MTTIVHGAGSTLRGWRQEEDFSVSLVVAQEPIGVDGTSEETVKDLTYAVTTTVGTALKSDVVVENDLANQPVTFSSLTPAVCSVDSYGAVTLITEGQCDVEVSGQTGKRVVSQPISTVGMRTIYGDVTSMAAGSLRRYLYDQQIAALAGVTPGSEAQRAFQTLSDSPSGAVNADCFIRAQNQPDFHPFQLDVLDEMLVGVDGRWRAWITPHHYLTWLGHGSTSNPGQWVSNGEAVVRYSADPWTGNLCKLLPANWASYLPPTVISNDDALPLWSRFHNTYNAGADKKWVMPVHRNRKTPFAADDPRRPFQRWAADGTMANGGDSGSPAWIGIREGANSHATMVPIGMTSHQWGVATMAFHIIGLDSIQWAVDTLNASGPFTVQTVDLSGFSTYP